jgi:phage I-like protein
VTTKRARKTKTTNHKVLSAAVSLSVDSAALPTEFRLFVAGWNDTEQGRFLFDAAAAKLVMAAHTKWGVDLSIDLEHQMLEHGIAPESTAKDARGWFRLALRPDGSLWAVDVKWTADGAQRLSEKRQRYISPAFTVDPETSRVTSIINAAITAMPATHETPALIAASINGAPMNPETAKEALDAIESGDAAKCAEILKAMIAEAASGAPPEAPPSEPMAEELSAPPVPPQEEEKKAEVVAATSLLMRITAAKTISGAVAEVETWKKSHIELETERVKLAKERDVLENAERREGGRKLVVEGGRAPANVWADPDTKTLKSYLASMPIADFRAYVDDAIKASTGKPALKPPPAEGGAAPASATANTIVALSNGEKRTLKPREVAMCKEMNIDLKDYAATKPAEMNQ